MFFICNNSLLFDPEAHTVSVVGEPESVLTLSAPAVRLLQEFIRHKGSELSREELITRVWQEFGFTPSGNNLNKAISELRKSFQALGEHHELIVTIPRYGFRFDADVIFQPAQNIDTSAPQPQLQKAEKRKQPPRLKWWLIFTALLASVFGIGIIIRQQQNITTPVRLKPIFTLSEGMADLLNEFVSVEDSLNMPDSFWYVWRRFKGHIIDSISNQGWKHDKDRIIESFLFARVPWKDEAKTWHTFSPENRSFFSDLSGKIGGESSFIYSIGKLLCGIGSDFLDDGIYWISHSIKTFDIDLSQDKSGNTLFFLERYMRRYLFKNHDKVRRTPNLKAQSMVVLDFLVEQYSITGYLLREDIA